MTTKPKYIPKTKEDDLNENYLFCGIATDLLAAAVNGQIDLKQLAMNELRNRGLDKNGKWIGFNRVK